MKILALLGAIQGIILVLYVISSKKNRFANINFLFGILICIVQMLLVSYVENPNRTNGNLYLKLTTWVLPFLIPIFAYFYFRFLVGNPRSYRKFDLLFFLPFGLSVFAVLPYAKLGMSPNFSWEQINENEFALQGLFHMFFYSAVIIFFSIKIMAIYEDYKEKILRLYSNFEEKQLIWIKGNAIGFFAIGLTGLISSLLQLIKISNPVFNITQIWTPDYLMFIPVSLLFYWCGYKAISVPELFRFVEDSSGKKEKYSNSVIKKEEAEQLADRLLNLMNIQQDYLDPNLKLSDVATRLDISKQLLSQLLNQHFEQNFFDFINSYRINTAKEKLVDPTLRHLSIQGIALESGFKSKSTFYDLFKKNTGTTPKQFQKSN